MGSGRTALLVGDAQVGAIERFTTHPEVVERIADAIRGARSLGIPIIYSVLRFRPGHPEAHPRNRVVSGIAAAGLLTEPDPEGRIHPQLAPQDNDIVIVKQRIGAFHGSDLDVVLRGLQVDTLALAGVATSGVVLATFFDAVDRDYATVVLSDACSDRDSALHDILMAQVFSRGQVHTAAGWLATLA
jgi:nicotinamidase-related amidase